MNEAVIACPTCAQKLTHYSALGVTIDGCKDGCGGIWFDSGELDRFEDLGERPPFEVLRLKKNSEVIIDRSKTRTCPRCVNQPLSVRLLEETLGLEVDSCMNCAGTWLDLGELRLIREDRKEIQEMNDSLAELESKAEANEAFWPKGLKAVLKLIFS